MFLDARDLPDGHLVESDVAVVGSGPSGMTLTRVLASRGFDVTLLESGGREPDGATNDLARGEVRGRVYPLPATRQRYFGGSSNHWGGYCRPLDPIDFEAREWVAFSGWPFGREELAPYYGPASEIVEIAPARFDDVAYWQAQTEEPRLGLVAGRLTERFYQFSPPTRFASRYGPELAASARVRVLLYANLVRILAAESLRAIDHLEVRTLTGRTHRVRARAYVLAAGGLENPRLLLASRDRIPEGIGNQNGLVGRFFMEHPHVGGVAQIVMRDPRRLPRVYRERVVADGRAGRAAFFPTADFLRRERLLNVSFTVTVKGRYRGDEQEEPAAEHLRMLRAAEAFLIERRPESAETETQGAWVSVGCRSEQVPNPDSRVTLSSETDALGMPRLVLDWRLTEQDRRSIAAHVRSLAYELGALGLGRLQMHIADDGLWPERVGVGSHHMGTTRMSDDPRRGVVDRDCRVHGLENLYIAGSSVFPTGGAVNPTLTIVALALRLGDHLGGRLA